MKVRKYNSTDYNTLCSWWEGYKHPIVPQKMLSNCGYIIDDKIACFLYKTNSSLAWLEFMIGNPKLNKETRDESISMLVNKITQDCKDDGYEMIFSNMRDMRLAKRATKEGFYPLKDSIPMFKGVL